MALHSILPAQTDPKLILPTNADDGVKLWIADFDNGSVDRLGYEYLSVFVGDTGDSAKALAVQGKYRFKDGYLEFTPAFPFESGLQYLLRFKPSNSEEDYAYHPFVIGKTTTAEQARVINIYPSTDALPENLLRFYIYFSTPMKKGQSLRHIQLRDSTGNVDSRAFMEFKYELWSPDGKRLTILFDPGRIKRGVSTNLELGPALLEGMRYELTISGSWQDVYGNELNQDFTKRFTAVKAYRQHIEIRDWKIQVPSLNSHDTLRVNCDRLMDHALAQSMIQIQDEQNGLISGHWQISEHEQTLYFVPENEWAPGKYGIVFRNELEDVAGNNLVSLLDQRESSNEDIPGPSYVIHFEIL